MTLEIVPEVNKGSEKWFLIALKVNYVILRAGNYIKFILWTLLDSFHSSCES